LQSNGTAAKSEPELESRNTNSNRFIKVLRKMRVTLGK
jgi:hypothetical protein